MLLGASIAATGCGPSAAPAPYVVPVVETANLPPYMTDFDDACLSGFPDERRLEDELAAKGWDRSDDGEPFWTRRQHASNTHAVALSLSQEDGVTRCTMAVPASSWTTLVGEVDALLMQRWGEVAERDAEAGSVVWLSARRDGAQIVTLTSLGPGAARAFLAAQWG